MDEIATALAERRPVKEWAVLYWSVVAIGHLLEWSVTRRDGMKQKRDELLTAFVAGWTGGTLFGAVFVAVVWLCFWR